MEKGDLFMKVCQIVEAGGGVSKHLTKLAKYVNDKKIDQYFIVSSVREDGLIEVLKSNNCKFIIIDMVRNINPIYDVVSFIKIYTFLLKNKIDVVHCHSAKAGFIGRLAATVASVPVKIYSPHAFPFNNYISCYKKLTFKYLEKFVGLFTSVIIASSETEYDIAIDNRIVNCKKLCLIHNGIETEYEVTDEKLKLDLFKNVNINCRIDENTKVIGFISRLVPQKDPITFIRAIANMKNKNFVALVCGDGELENDVMQEAENLGIKDKIMFLGYREDLFNIINAIDIFILPSLWEGLPYILLEAMLCKKVIFATNVVGNRDVIKNEINGFLFEPRDYIGLSKLLDLVIVDDVIMNNVKINAHRDVIENYSVDNMVNKYEDLYLKLCLKGRNG